MLEELRQLESNLYENKLRTIDYMEKLRKYETCSTKLVKEIHDERGEILVKIYNIYNKLIYLKGED